LNGNKDGDGKGIRNILSLLGAFVIKNCVGGIIVFLTFTK
jgi:hypothetical protein